MRLSNIVLAIVLLAPVSAGAQIGIRPGQYEFTLDMDLPVPGEATKAVLDGAGFKGQKKLECLTADDVKESKDIAKVFAREAADANCKMSDVKTTGNKMTFVMTCVDDDVRMTMNTEMTFGADSFSTVTKGKDQDGRPSTAKMTARRIGECKR